jgi:hypothetical protein
VGYSSRPLCATGPRRVTPVDVVAAASGAVGLGSPGAAAGVPGSRLPRPRMPPGVPERGPVTESVGPVCPSDSLQGELGQVRFWDRHGG